MSDLIERIKKRMECRRWKMARDTTPIEALEVKFGNEMLDMCLEIIDEESSKEPQVQATSDCIGRKKLIEEIRNCVHCDRCGLRNRCSKNVCNVSLCLEIINNQPQVQPTVSKTEIVRTLEEIAEMRCDMKRLTHRYTDRQAFVSMNMLIPVMENEIVGLPITKLAHYEDLEEQGKLIELPCKVGDTVYYIANRSDEYGCGYYKTVMNCEFTIDKYYELGKTVFLTHEEAEQALAEMESGE